MTVRTQSATGQQAIRLVINLVVTDLPEALRASVLRLPESLCGLLDICPSRTLLATGMLVAPSRDVTKRM